MTTHAEELATKSLPEIVAAANSYPSSQGFRDAALACLLVANTLRPDDLALADLRVAAQTFATLAAAEASIEVAAVIERVRP